MDFSDDLIKSMVNRFLAWKLPKDFMPDGGIHFSGGDPIGTNLFTADQAEAMILNMLMDAQQEEGAEYPPRTPHHYEETSERPF